MRCFALFFVVPLFTCGMIVGCGSAVEPDGSKTVTADASSTPSPEQSTESQTLPAAEAATTPTKNQPGQQSARQAKAPVEPKNVEPASVREAIALLDLRALDLPKGAESATGDPTNITVVAPLKIADASKFYVDQLAKQGWQPSSEPNTQQLTEQYAQGLYTKQGYRISLFITTADEKAGTVSVMLRNHGNVDTRGLPAPAGAKPLYESASTTIFVSAAKVAEVADACRKQLAAAGWQEYGPAFSSQAENADSVSLTFRKRGTELSAFIGVAPAQGGKTTMQYGVSLLENELPWPTDATAVEFDPNRPYLACETPQSLDKVVEFYRQQLAELGWSNRDNLDKVEEDHGTLYFDDAAGNRILVRLDGRMTPSTKVEIEHFSAELLAKMAEQEAESQKPAEPEPTEPATKIAARSLPLPKEAKKVAYEAAAEEIRFISAHSVEQLIEFFREKLDNETWKEDRNFTLINENAGSMELENGPARLSFLMIHTGLNADTEVRISTQGLAWDEAPQVAADDPPMEANTDTPQAPEEPEKLVAELKDGLPVPNNYTSLSSESTGFRKSVQVTTPAALPQVVEFYRQELTAANWKEVAEQAGIEDNQARLTFSGPDGQLAVKIDRADDGTHIELVIKDEAAAKKAGLLPKPGKARVIFGNMTKQSADLTLNKRNIKLRPGEGEKNPDGPSLDLAPGKYKLTVKIGSGQPSNEEIEVGADETWGVIVGEGGALPLLMY